MPPPRPSSKLDLQDQRLEFAIDGVDYVLDVASITPEMSRIYRRATGAGLMGDLMQIEDGDPAAFVALWWAARWTSGERIPVGVIEKQISSFGDLLRLDIEITTDDDDETDSPSNDDTDVDPEASGEPGHPTSHGSPSAESSPGSSNGSPSGNSDSSPPI